LIPIQEEPPIQRKKTFPPGFRKNISVVSFMTGIEEVPESEEHQSSSRRDKFQIIREFEYKYQNYMESGRYQKSFDELDRIESSPVRQLFLSQH